METNTESPVAKVKAAIKKSKAIKAKFKASKKNKGVNTSAGKYAPIGDITGKKVKLLVKENPKRGEAAKRFGLYRNGISAETVLEKGVTRNDLRWDVAHGFIALH